MCHLRHLHSLTNSSPTTFLSRWHNNAEPLHSFPSPPPLTSLNIHTNHVSLSIFASFLKYIIASYHPISCCFFQRVKIESSMFATEKVCLFPAFVALVWAITSGCDERVVAFSRATALMAGFLTVRKRCCRCIPVWWRRSTQSSILSPTHPGCSAFDRQRAWASSALWGWRWNGALHSHALLLAHIEGKSSYHFPSD